VASVNRSIEDKSSFTPGKPKQLWSRAGPNFPGVPQYDVAPAGRFLTIGESEASTAPTQLNVVLNWTEELTNRAGGAKR
jgi:hypothetical protein